MALEISATQLTTGGNGTDGTSFNTASISPSANKLILLAVGSRGGIPSSISGCGLTFELIDSALTTDNVQRLSLYRAISASPSSGAINIQFAATQANCTWSVTEITNSNAHASDNGAGAIVQSQDGIVEGTNSGLTINLGAFTKAANATFGAVRNNGSVAITPGTGFTELGEAQAEATIEAEFRKDNDTSVNWTWSSAGNRAAGVAIEIAVKVLAGNRGYVIG